MGNVVFAAGMRGLYCIYIYTECEGPTIWVMDRLRTIWGLDAGQTFALGREPKWTQTRGRDDTALLARKKTCGLTSFIVATHVKMHHRSARISAPGSDGPTGEQLREGHPNIANVIVDTSLYNQHVQHAHQETPNWHYTCRSHHLHHISGLDDKRWPSVATGGRSEAVICDRAWMGRGRNDRMM